MPNECVAGHAWSLLSSQTPQKQPGSGSDMTAEMTWQFSDRIWRLAWIQMTVFAESHHYHSFVDPYCPLDV